VSSFLLDLIKMSRIDNFIRRNTQEQEVLQQIDGDRIVQTLRAETTLMLDKVLAVELP
jgi:hypothetical protein